MDELRISRAVIALALVGVFVGASALSILLVSPVADAGTDQTVDVGELVQFDGSGSQNAAQYWWNFRDNGWCNSTVSPTRTYQTEGVYFVGLLVIASNGQQSLDMVKITVRNDPPVANAGQNVTAFEDDTLTFNGAATVDSAVDLPSLTYGWDFGDGCNASGISVTHSYQNAGVYRALLSVTDDQGAIGRSVRNITILNKEPTATVSDVVADEGTAFTICAQGEDTASDKQSLRYEWDNGKFGEETSYRYDRPGEYHPQVTVRDNNNAIAVATGNVVVRNDAPIAGILGVTAKTNLSVNITLRASGEKWHDLQLYICSNGTLMGNASIYRVPGNPDEQAVTISDFIFNLKNPYQIITYYTPEDDPINGQTSGDTPAWITFTFEDGSYETINHNFNVEQQSTWIWEIDPTPYLYGHMIEFEGFTFDPGAGNLTTTWDFGDGTTVTNYHTATNAPAFVLESVSHSFPSTGTFSIRLLGLDECGGSGEYLLSITIDDQGDIIAGNPAPRISIKGSIGVVDESTPACLIVSAIDSEADNISYQWFFGDGSSSFGLPSFDDNVAFHSYNYSGTYIVTVVARDDQNAIGIAYTEIRVENIEPTAIILGNTIRQEDEISIFSGSSSSDTPNDQQYLTYVWDFGDGTVAIGVNATHVYRLTGFYNVTLAVIDNDGDVSISVAGIEVILPELPNAEITDKMAYGPVLPLSFYGIGNADASEVFELDYTWDFGDGSPAVTGMELVHAYSMDGFYQVTLTVTDRYGQTAIANAAVYVGIDSDGDSLTDSQEASEGTDSNNPDTDGDSLIDYWEKYVYETSPVESDSDYDGVNDWYEAIYFGYNVDTDNDTLLNPWDNDSDDDGVLDGLDVHPLEYDMPDIGTFPYVCTASSGSDVDEQGNPISGLAVTAGIRFLNNSLLMASSSIVEQADALGVQKASIAADSTNPSCGIIITPEDPHWDPLSQTYFTNLLYADLTGTASDDIGVTSVTWSNAANGASGTATGTTSWSINGINLMEKGMNIITVTAHDASGNVGSDTIKIDTEYIKVWINFHFRRGPRLGLAEGGLLPAISIQIYNTLKAPLGTFDEIIEVRYPFSDPIVSQLMPYQLVLYQYDNIKGFMPIPSSSVGGELGNDKVTAHVVFNTNSYYHMQLYEIVASDLRDPDEDGLTDYEELYKWRHQWYSDPFDRDTDDDGLSDLMEHDTTLTSPNSPDSDCDGLYDGWNDLNKDGDWDSNEPKGEVGQMLPAGVVGGFGTNPIDYDSDNDGLYDGWQDLDFDRQWDLDNFENAGEIGDQTQNYAGGYGTSPTNPDYDNDGVPDGEDLDPLRELELHVCINEISLWSENDDIDSSYTDYADYYWVVEVHQLGADPYLYWWDASAKPYAWDTDDISPNLEFEFTEISNDGSDYESGYIYVTIELFDINKNDGTVDGTYDVDGTSSVDKYAIMIYSIRHNYWWGDDSHYDNNGYGNLCGHDDGETDDNDCFMMFDIHTNDNDEYPSYEEARYRAYGYDPMNSDDDADYDGDGIPDGYEKKHGIHGSTLDIESDEWDDFDEDGVPNLWEYELAQEGYPKSPDNPSDTFSPELNISLSDTMRATLGIDYDDWLTRFENSIIYSNNYLFEAWDGYAAIKHVNIFEDGQNFNTADIRVIDVDAPNSSTYGWATFYPIGWFITLPRLEAGHLPDNYAYFTGLPHELGHWIKMRSGATCGLGEEYRDDENKYIDNETTWMHSIMADNELYVEFSTASDYANPGNHRTDTDQAVTINPSYKSCWQTIFAYYNFYSNEQADIMFDLDQDGRPDHDFPQSFIPEIIGNYLTGWTSTYVFDHLSIEIE